MLSEGGKHGYEVKVVEVKSGSEGRKRRCEVKVGSVGA